MRFDRQLLLLAYLYSLQPTHVVSTAISHNQPPQSSNFTFANVGLTTAIQTTHGQQANEESSAVSLNVNTAESHLQTNTTVHSAANVLSTYQPKASLLTNGLSRPPEALLSASTGATLSSVSKTTGACAYTGTDTSSLKESNSEPVRSQQYVKFPNSTNTLSTGFCSQLGPPRTSLQQGTSPTAIVTGINWISDGSFSGLFPTAGEVIQRRQSATMSSTESTASNNALSVFNEAISSFAKASATDVVDSSTQDPTTTSDSSSAPSTSQTVESSRSSTSPDPTTSISSAPSPSQTVSSPSSTSSDPTPSTKFSRSTAQTSTAQTSFSTSLPTLSTLRTVASRTTSLSDSAVSAETAGAGSPLNSTEKLQDGPVAGIATGAAAGVVLILLIALFCLRRRKQNKLRRASEHPSRSNSQRVFPEVAWLYDPKTSGKDNSHSYQEVKQIPSRQTSPERSPDPSTALLVPEPRDGAVEMPSAPPSPNMRASNSSEPLLAPGPTLFPSNRGSTETLRYSAELRSANQSPVRKVRNSMHSSRTDLQRPMSAIYENVPLARPNYEAREGLLAPPDGRGLEVWHER